MTTTATAADMKAEIRALGQRFWAGEAEIARNFLTAPHEPADHVHWLRHQCYRELRGPGLLARAHSRVQWIIDNIGDSLPAAESREGRDEFEYQLESLRQEFTHFRLLADILEDVTGEPVRMSSLDGLRLPSDDRIEAMRARLIAENERIAHIAYSFAEGGGAGIFHAGAAPRNRRPAPAPRQARLPRRLRRRGRPRRARRGGRRERPRHRGGARPAPPDAHGDMHRAPPHALRDVRHRAGRGPHRRDRQRPHRPAPNSLPSPCGGACIMSC